MVTKTKRVTKKKVTEPVALKLDLGSGKNTREGFEGVDSRDFGQKHKADLRKPWPWKDNSVDEVWCSHFVEHLTLSERIHFANELFRVLKPGAKATIITPHFSSNRAYGDMTHQWPPVAEMWFYYLNSAWREVNAPHNDEYTCNFDGAPVFGYSVRPDLQGKNQEYLIYALSNYKEACQDLITTLTKPNV